MGLYGGIDEDGCPANKNQQCLKYNITRDDIFYDTIATKHNLLCQNDYISKHISTIQLTGCLVGGLLFGYIGDQLGRRKALLISAVGACLSSICVALFSEKLWAYTLFRFLAAGFINGSIPISLVYSVEFVGAKYRSYTGSAAYIIFDFGLAFLSFIGLTVQGWKMQAIVLRLIFHITAPLTYSLYDIGYYPLSGVSWVNFGKFENHLKFSPTTNSSILFLFTSITAIHIQSKQCQGRKESPSKST